MKREIGKMYIIHDYKVYWLNGFAAKIIRIYKTRAMISIPVDDDKLRFISLDNLGEEFIKIQP